jgi:oxygen-independent coproporphyrinogen-3 oxidase
MAGIYLHIPFCKKLCNYCDFYHILSNNDHSEFIDAVINEASLRKDYLAGESVSTIYIGGGTPSVFSLFELERILQSLKVLFPVEENCETTIEINPDDVNPEFMRGLRKLKINRISMGVQSWRDEDLKFLNRRHDAAGAKKALKEVSDAGFENISVDLIYGIPGMNKEDWAANLDHTFNFNISHLSAYHLTIEPGTVFGKMKEKGLLSEIGEEDSNVQFNILLEKAENAGFIQYEISNFGKPGFFSLHNSNYWKQVSYIGLGPSAHSFNGYSRQWNINNLNVYIRSVKNNKPFFEKEELTSRSRFNEYIMISLRTMWGIDLDYVESIFGKEGYDYLINITGKFRTYGLMKFGKNTLVLTNQGKMISDNIISEIMMVDQEPLPGFKN